MDLRLNIFSRLLARPPEAPRKSFNSKRAPQPKKFGNCWYTALSLESVSKKGVCAAAVLLTVVTPAMVAEGKILLEYLHLLRFVLKRLHVKTNATKLL